MDINGVLKNNSKNVIIVLIVAPALCDQNHYLAVIIPGDGDRVRYRR